MLNPDHRSLVTDLLTPPPGMVVDSGIATTYTLDPVTLLTVPLHLAWLASGQDPTMLADGIRLLEALRRVGDRLTVYADRGRIQAPTQAHALYAFLESMIIEVRAPNGGAFHPKIWVLRFIDPENDASPILRVAILSRNLTADRSWDLSLVLEGRPGGRNTADNRELGEFVASLPELAVGPVPDLRRAAAERLGEEIRRTSWDLPAGWDKVGFHIMGLRRRRWSPPPSAQMVVISPFLSAPALDMLCQTTDEPVALISRPEAMASLDSVTRKRFSRCLVFDEAAESEDGEDTSARDTLGLHAKAIVLKHGWDTVMFVGSANATAPAMVNGTNIEVWAEITGKRSGVGGIDDLLDREKGGLGGLLTDFDPTTPKEIPDDEAERAKRALEEVRQALVGAALSVRCEGIADDWRLVLLTTKPVTLGTVRVSVWPLSLREDRSVDAAVLAIGADIDLGVVATADITGLTGFLLGVGEVEIRFALNLPVLGLPEERDAAILRRIVRNRDGFLRYLLLLLGQSGEDGGRNGKEGGRASWGDWTTASGAEFTLLEEMVRAFSRDPARLADVRRVVDRLRGDDSDDGIIPPEFLALWSIFERALEGSR